jgi:amino acid permease
VSQQFHERQHVAASTPHNFQTPVRLRKNESRITAADKKNNYSPQNRYRNQKENEKEQEQEQEQLKIHHSIVIIGAAIAAIVFVQLNSAIADAAHLGAKNAQCCSC